MQPPTPDNSKLPTDSKSAAIASLSPKSGIRTTQLWLIIGVIALIAAAVFSGYLNGAWLGIVAPLLAGFYANLREQVYSDYRDHPNDQLDKILATVLNDNQLDGSELVSIVKAIRERHGLEAPVLAVPSTLLVTQNATTKTEGQESNTKPQSDAVQAASAASPGAGGAAGATAAIVLFFGLLLGACSTTQKNAWADFLTSPGTEAVASAFAKGLTDSLILSAGSKIPESAQAPLMDAAGAVASGTSTAILYATAQALRTQQGTTTSASSSTLAAAMTNQADTPAAVSAVVAKGVSALAASGIAGDTANEAMASALDAAAKAQASPLAPASGKAIVPLQSATVYRRTLYGANDQPIFPRVVTSWEVGK